MGENSNIEWTHHTFNPWWGCAHVSPGCDNCYADAFAKRVLPRHTTLWEPNGERRYFGKEYWLKPLAWERKAAKEGVRHRVFCASMADVFDNHPDLPPVREMLWDLIRRTPHLDWLLLTKRVGNVMSMVPWYSYRGHITPEYHFPANVWIGATIANQPEADRDIVKLLKVPARVRFISFEPLLGPIRLSRLHAYCPIHDFPGGFCTSGCSDLILPDWAIIGGESGPGARSMVLGWAKDLVRDCRASGIAPFVKQLGARPINREGEPHPISDRKGAVMAEWPEVLRVREFPETTHV